MGAASGRAPAVPTSPGMGAGLWGELGWGLLLGMARGMTGLIYSGNVKGKWNKEKAWCSVSGQNAVTQQQKRGDAECCAHTSGEALLWQPSCRHTPISEPSPDAAPGTCTAGRCPGSSPLALSPPQDTGQSLEGTQGSAAV